MTTTDEPLATNVDEQQVDQQRWASPEHIFARARAQRCQPEAMDPHKLILLVEQILIDQGLHPDRGGHHKTALIAACRLLRALGILPSGDYTYLDRHNSAYPEQA